MSRVIDCDSHVEECNATWDNLDEQYHHRRPLAVTMDERETNRISP